MTKFTETNMLITITTDLNTIYAARTALRAEAVAQTRMGNDDQATAFRRAAEALTEATMQAHLQGNSLPMLYDSLDDDKPLGQ